MQFSMTGASPYTTRTTVRARIASQRGDLEVRQASGSYRPARPADQLAEIPGNFFVHPDGSSDYYATVRVNAKQYTGTDPSITVGGQTLQLQIGDWVVESEGTYNVVPRDAFASRFTVVTARAGIPE